ncbi:exporter [Arcobacter nitrofigilis DSM 7299]|uniref:Exporter n=1 Tax=Arcobacter nitrofigilis (strain ATCC 33309 / DSM 7299 / CCUG 15893 / LMG 7604 / NCTC 12251 / CI) TaxID=572480 RepID=D5V108_ARCNC|nr:exporter [Arcobacter nitrofigilis]ADG93970.1 exporter [Arcobacter nitrofigilis DSM 7299]
MFKLTNYINILALFVLIILTLSFGSFNHISTDLQSIIPNSEKKELLNEFNTFKSTKKIFLSVEGLDNNALTKIKKLENSFSKIEGVSFAKIQENENLKKYKDKYKVYIEKLDKKSLDNLNITKKLEEIKSNLLKSNFSYFINKQDPLNLFFKATSFTNLSIKNNHLSIKDKAYISIFNLDNSINTISKYEKIYDSIEKTISNEKNIKVFSPIFYFVENSRTIKNDVNKIIAISTLLLILLYLVILKNVKLLLNTIVTLVSSILFSLLLCSFFFDKLSIFVMVFGISISTVAIDYMFHHYMHDYYEKKKAFNKDVFLGMFTTVGAFIILSFVSFDLIKQFCYFSIISLLFSYYQFAFLYPKIKFSKKSITTKYYKLYSKIRPIYVIFFAVVLLIFSIDKFHFDLNLKNLDVNNTRLKQTEKYFNNSLDIQKNMPVLIKAKSIEKLIEDARILKNKYPNSYIPISVLIDEKSFLDKKLLLQKIDLKSIKEQLNKKAIIFGFKNNYFKDAYNLNENIPIYTKESINDLGIELLHFKDYYLTYANLPKDKIGDFSKYDFIVNISIKTMFEQNLSSIYDELIAYGAITILFILFMLFLSTKDNYLLSFAYLIFPIALILSLSFFMTFNILHLFMLFIILSISIDFGIYLGSKNLDKNTYIAIFYSLLSTFAGFGVLIFSKVNALFSIGVVASVGILAITLLIIILKRPSYDS